MFLVSLILLSHYIVTALHCACIVVATIMPKPVACTHVLWSEIRAEGIIVLTLKPRVVPLI
jgi:hypothetical protein